MTALIDPGDYVLVLLGAGSDRPHGTVAVASGGRAVLRKLDGDSPAAPVLGRVVAWWADAIL